MTDKDKRIAAAAVLRKSAEMWRAFSGRVPTRSSAADSRKKILALAGEGDKETFVSAKVAGGRARWFWASKVVPDDFHGRIIAVSPFMADKRAVHSGVLEHLAAEARNFHRAKRLTVQLRLARSDKKLLPVLIRRGWHLGMFLLSGRVSDSLRYLRALPRLPAGLRLRRLDMKSERSAYLRLVVRAVKSDPTCTMYHMSPAAIRKAFLKFEKSGLKRITYGIYYGRRLAGCVTAAIKETPARNGLIATIGLLPLYRGLGLSKHLYRTALLWFRARGAGRYVGISSTSAVLSLSKKMRRTVASITLCLGCGEVR